MLGNDIADKFLNDTQVRSALRRAIPEVDKLEALVETGAGLNDLRLLNASVYVYGDGTILGYTARAATPEFYAGPLKALVGAGVIDPVVHDPIWVNTHKGGGPDESKFLEIHRDGLELSIDILNRSYQTPTKFPVIYSTHRPLLQA